MAGFYRNGLLRKLLDTCSFPDVAREDQTSLDKLKKGGTPPCNEGDYVDGARNFAPESRIIGVCTSFLPGGLPHATSRG